MSVYTATKIHSSAQSFNKECSQCHATDKKTKVCAQCHLERYCGRACQKKAWPKHKKACLAVKALNKAIKIETNPFRLGFPSVSDYAQQETPKQINILNASKQLLQAGYPEVATKYIEEHTCFTSVRQQYFSAYVKEMVSKNPSSYKLALEKGSDLVSAGKQIRRTVIDELCMAKHFKTAYHAALEESDPLESQYLLTVVAAGLKIEKEYQLAAKVKYKQMDFEALQQLNRYS